MKRSAILWMGAAALVVALLAGGCGGSSKKNKSSSGSTAGAKGGTLITRANAAPAGSPDPQVNYTLQEWQFLLITHDGLVAFKRVGGHEGTKLVPDLATSIPKPTNNGKVWKFTLRSGIKFSNGKTLTGNDVKATFERLFKIGNSPNAGSWYNAIQGGDACVKTPKTCDLSEGVQVNGNTVTFRLARGNPEFLDQLAMPFTYILPADTPVKNLNIPPAGTGPYKWVEYSPQKQMRIVRNPYFKEWSKDAQPEGLPDEIVQKFGLSVEAEVTQVENGTTDWIANADSIPSDRLNEISTKYPKQVHINPLVATWYFAFNTRIPPFNNLKARQAVNYATDRKALIKIYGGPQLAVPTCQVLPPNFPGYQPYCPYTIDPRPGATWTGPDLVTARKLVAASGTAGMKVVVGPLSPRLTPVAEYIQSVLKDLGYDAGLEVAEKGSDVFKAIFVDKRVEVGGFEFNADFPAPDTFLGQFACGREDDPTFVCDEKLDAAIKAAESAGASDPAAANQQWAEVDRMVTDLALWAPMLNEGSDFVSSRLGNYQFNVAIGFLADQAWVQ